MIKMNPLEKLKYSRDILLFGLKSLPIRVKRLITHLVFINEKIGLGFKRRTYIIEWLLSSILLLLDIVLIPELLSIVFIWVNKVRGLSPKEKEIKTILFNKSLEIPIILNDNARITTNKGKYAFVGYYIVNSCGMSERTFAHELVHFYQFSKFGSAYIIRSLLAQRSINGYNYGGVENLKQMMELNAPAKHLNYEQQGEVLADYYTLIKSVTRLNCTAYENNVSYYRYILDQW